MKKIIALSAFALSVSLGAHAENIIRVSAPIVVAAPPAEIWLAHGSLTSEWVISGDFYECSSQSPLASTISSGFSFQQTYASCSQNESRSIQPQVIGSISGEVKPFGSPSTETRSKVSLSGQRFTTGTYAPKTIDYSIAGLASNGLGAGYYKQLGGGYNFGTSMQKTASGDTMLASVIYYSGNYSVQVVGTTDAAINAVDNTKYDTSRIKPYISPYNGVRFFKKDGTLLATHPLTNISDTRNYYGKTTVISASDYNIIFSNIGLIGKIQLFE
jgi:hypothetical protein